MAGAFVRGGEEPAGAFRLRNGHRPYAFATSLSADFIEARSSGHSGAADRRAQIHLFTSAEPRVAQASSGEASPRGAAARVLHARDGSAAATLFAAITTDHGARRAQTTLRI